MHVILKKARTHTHTHTHSNTYTHTLMHIDIRMLQVSRSQRRVLALKAVLTQMLMYIHYIYYNNYYYALWVMRQLAALEQYQ